MANIEGMANKFTVLKNEDIENGLSYEGKVELGEISKAINLHRAISGKKPNTYLVINTDEPYADEVIDILKRHGHWR